MRTIIKKIKKYLLSRCWHEFQYVSSFEPEMQNDHLRPIVTEVSKCVKCGEVREQNFYKDLYYLYD